MVHTLVELRKLCEKSGSRWFQSKILHLNFFYCKNSSTSEKLYVLYHNQVWFISQFAQELKIDKKNRVFRLTYIFSW